MNNVVASKKDFTSLFKLLYKNWFFLCQLTKSVNNDEFYDTYKSLYIQAKYLLLKYTLFCLN